jgi:hypothetical protein
MKNQFKSGAKFMKKTTKLQLGKILLFVVILISISCKQSTSSTENHQPFDRISDAKFFTIQGLTDPNPSQAYLIVDLRSGFSNRMRALGAAYSAAITTKRQLAVIWSKSFDCVGLFSDFFSNPIVELTEKNIGFDPELLLDPAFKNSDLKRYYANDKSYMELGNLAQESKRLALVVTPWSFLLKDKNFSEFLQEFKKALIFLKPIPEIQDRINAFITDNNLSNKKIIGVHHRSFGADTDDDHLPLASSPIMEHYSVIDEELKNSPESVFFLATDSLSTREKLLKKYNEYKQTVFTYPLKKISRNTIKSQREAIVEWFLLAQCSYLIGTNQSSFSDIPALLTKEQRKRTVGPPVWNYSDSICFNSHGTPVFCGENFDLANFDALHWSLRKWNPHDYSTRHNIVSKIRYLSSSNFTDLHEEPFDPTIEIIDDKDYILAFRFETEKDTSARQSFIGISILDRNLNIKKIGVKNNKDYIKLDLTVDHKKVKKSEGKEIFFQLEDPRLIKINNKLFLLFTESYGKKWNSLPRNMYISEILISGTDIQASKPIKLNYPFGERQNSTWGFSKDWNLRHWSPFVYNNELYLIYSLDQFVILKCDQSSGDCVFFKTSLVDKYWYRKFGKPIPGSQAILENGKYYQFFFSNAHFEGHDSNERVPYFLLGAYTFNHNPPFDLKKVTQAPIGHDDFYNEGGGRVVVNGAIYNPHDQEFILAIGRHNTKLGLAVINKSELDNTLIHLEKN